MKTEVIIASVIDDKIKSLEDLTKIQCQDGNWNYDPYMHGMANGMILSLNVFKDTMDNPYTGKKMNPEYLDAPKKWLKDSVIDSVIKLSYTVKLHLKDEDDDSEEVLKQLGIIQKYVDKMFKDINIKVVDASFGHEFGTEHDYDIEVDAKGNKLVIELTIDKVDEQTFKNVLDKFVDWVDGIRVKKIEYDTTEERIHKRPHWMPAKVKVNLKLVLNVKKKINDNTAIIEAYWEEK